MPRPKFSPTPDQRRMVRTMAGIGIPHEDIARKVRIRSAKTLRKHFRDELDLGRTDANCMVGTTLLEMATSGECPAATIFWSKTRMGFRERPETDLPPPPFLVVSQTGGPLYGRA